MDLQKLTADALATINAADNLDVLDQIRVDYLGKKGELTSLLKTLGKLPADERKAAGQDINKTKREVLFPNLISQNTFNFHSLCMFVYFGTRIISASSFRQKI